MCNVNPAIFLPFLFLCVCLSCSTKWKVPKQAMWCFAGSRDPSGISSHKDPPIHGGYLGLDQDDDNCPSLLHTKYFLKETRLKIRPKMRYRQLKITKIANYAK